ncbi:hypothetical protein [Humibacter soli]
MRTWPALCALGAGLVHLAVAASSPWWWALPLIAAAVVGLAWSLAFLIRDAPVLPQGMLAVALVPVAALGVSTTIDIMVEHDSTMAMGSGMTMAVAPPIFPLIAASTLDLVVAAFCAMYLRRIRAVSASTKTASTAGGAGPLRTITGILLGATLVALITVPAMGSTDVGHQASQHMTM